MTVSLKNGILKNSISNKGEREWLQSQKIRGVQNLKNR